MLPHGQEGNARNRGAVGQKESWFRFVVTACSEQGGASLEGPCSHLGNAVGPNLGIGEPGGNCGQEHFCPVSAGILVVLCSEDLPTVIQVLLPCLDYSNVLLLGPVFGTNFSSWCRTQQPGPVGLIILHHMTWDINTWRSTSSHVILPVYCVHCWKPYSLFSCLVSLIWNRSFLVATRLWNSFLHKAWLTQSLDVFKWWEKPTCSVLAFCLLCLSLFFLLHFFDFVDRYVSLNEGDTFPEAHGYLCHYTNKYRYRYLPACVSWGPTQLKQLGMPPWPPKSEHTQTSPLWVPYHCWLHT